MSKYPFYNNPRQLLDFGYFLDRAVTGQKAYPGHTVSILICTWILLPMLMAASESIVAISVLNTVWVMLYSISSSALWGLVWQVPE